VDNLFYGCNAFRPQDEAVFSKTLNVQMKQDDKVEGGAPATPKAKGSPELAPPIPDADFDVMNTSRQESRRQNNELLQTYLNSDDAEESESPKAAI
jgi:hypothetical protein